MIHFAKGHGTENDFVIVPDPDGALDLSPALVAAMCDRRAGVGGDGLLRVVRSQRDPDAAGQAGVAEWFMDYRNGDGSVAEMCGNGVRVFARYLVDHGLAKPGRLRVATRSGPREVELDAEGDVTVDMGAPRFPGPDGVEVWLHGRRYPAIHVDMGNPHAVVFVPDLAAVGSLDHPPETRPAGVYPHGVNVEFATVLGERRLAMRVHERGAGETRSCGTGACAVMAAAARRDGASSPASYVVQVLGGRLAISESAAGTLRMSGPAVIVAEGDFQPSFLRQPAI